MKTRYAVAELLAERPAEAKARQRWISQGQRSICAIRLLACEMGTLPGVERQVEVTYKSSQGGPLTGVTPRTYLHSDQLLA